MALVESKLSNAYETTLASALLADSADKTISVAVAPTDSSNTAISPSAALPMYLIIDPDSDTLREYVKVTAISGTTLTADRNIDTGGGSLKAHAIGAKVRQAAVAQMFDDLHDRINTIVSTDGTAVNTSTVSGITGLVKDENDMSSNSDTHLATQQSIKAYVDTQILTEDTLAEMNDTNISSPAAGHVLVYDNTASVWDNVAVTAGDLIDITGGDGTLEIDVDLTEASEDAIANGDYILFLDGGATGTPKKEAFADVATLLAGTGLTASSSVIGVDTSQNITALTGGDLTIYEDANNADVSFKMGTGAAESLTIEVLNGSSNKTAEEIKFSSATASSTANHGKFVFNVDGTDILTIDDGGIDIASGLSVAINGSDLPTSDTNTTYSAGTLLDLSTTTFNVDLTEAGEAAIADGDYILFLDGGATGTHAKEAIADVATLFAGTGLTATSSVIAVDSSQAITALTGGDLTIYDDTNNADVSFKMGTSATEALSIEVLNGSSNKTAEEIKIKTSTASGTANHGKISIYIDDTEILDIDDGGIDLASGMTFAINGTDIADTDTTYSAGDLIDLDGTQIDVDLSEASEAALADGDYVLFLDGGATGTAAKEAIADVATLFAGTGLTASSSVINVDSSQAITALTGGDLTIYEDANNADVSLKMGTSATESLSIEVLNGSSNKTAEEIKFSTATASSTANHGKITFNIDGTDIATIDDGGIDVASGLEFSVNGTAIGGGISASSTDTLTNKTIDADGTGNSISNIDIGNMTAAVVVTESDSIASNDNDTTLPTSAAVKGYVDAQGYADIGLIIALG